MSLHMHQKSQGSFARPRKKNNWILWLRIYVPHGRSKKWVSKCVMALPRLLTSVNCTPLYQLLLSLSRQGFWECLVNFCIKLWFDEYFHCQICVIKPINVGRNENCNYWKIHEQKILIFGSFWSLERVKYLVLNGRSCVSLFFMPTDMRLTFLAHCTVC